MSTVTTTDPTPVKVEKMSPGRWIRVVGWRHLILVIALYFMIFKPWGYEFNS